MNDDRPYLCYCTFICVHLWFWIWIWRLYKYAYTEQQIALIITKGNDTLKHKTGSIIKRPAFANKPFITSIFCQGNKLLNRCLGHAGDYTELVAHVAVFTESSAVGRWGQSLWSQCRGHDGDHIIAGLYIFFLAQWISGVPCGSSLWCG